jgi:RND family efflux transporter MFP subunit
MKQIVWLLLLLSSSLSHHAFAADYDAKIEFAPHNRLGLPLSGVVTKVNVVPGQLVNKGSVLLELDPLPFEAARSHAQALVTIHQAELKESMRDLNHQEELYDRTVLATVELENAQLRVKKDKAHLQDAETRLAEAEYELGYTRLIAPFDALILDVEVNPGQAINNSLQGITLVTIVEQGIYQAVFDVPARDMDKLVVGSAVMVNLNGNNHGATISGIRYEPSPAGTGTSASSSQHYTVKASFNMPGNVIAIGQDASVHVD